MYPRCLFLIRSSGREELLRAEEKQNDSLFFSNLPVFCLSGRHGINIPHLIQNVDFAKLLHRRSAPPDEGEASLSNWQADSNTCEVLIAQYLNTIPSQLLSSETLTLKWGKSSPWYPGDRHVMLNCLGSERWSLSAFVCLQI